MNGIVKTGLRFVGTTKYIPNNTRTKYLGYMCHGRKVFSHITRNSITSAHKESAGYWKMIKAVTKKTLWYSTIPLSIIVGYYTYLVKTDPRFWETFDMLTAVDDETLKYSIIPSKIITSSVLFDDGEIKIKTRENNINLMNDNTRNLIIGEELYANIQEPFPKGKPIPIKIGKLHGLLGNGKLTIKTEEGDTTFTFHHTVCLEVKKTSTTLQNEIAVEKKKQPGITLEKIGKFNVITPGSKTTLKTSKGEKKWTGTDSSDKNARLNLPSFYDTFPIIGNFSVSSDNTVKIQEDDSDEVYYFNQSVIIECEKKLDENLPNKVATKKLSMIDIRTQEIKKTCDVSIDSGTVVFKTQNGDKFVVRHIIDIQVLEDGEKTYLHWVPRSITFN